ncbi:MAG: hypothetical protein WCX71_04855 [Candidatus Buchananbacteria bacterium]
MNQNGITIIRRDGGWTGIAIRSLTRNLGVKVSRVENHASMLAIQTACTKEQVGTIVGFSDFEITS